MKKYIKPITNVVEIEVESIIANSPYVPFDLTGETNPENQEINGSRSILWGED